LGQIKISRSLLADGNNQLWNFLKGSCMMPPSESETDKEHSSDFEAGGVHGTCLDSPDESGGAATARCLCSSVSRASIQMLAFEAVARRMWDAASLAKPHLQRLRMRDVVGKEDDCHVRPARGSLPREPDGSSTSDESTSGNLISSEYGCGGNSDAVSYAYCRKLKSHTSRNHTRPRKGDSGHEKRSKPTPARTAFQYFCVAVSQDQGQQQRNSKLCWKALGEKEIQYYSELAARDVERHRQEMEQWQAAQTAAATRGRRGRQKLR